MTLARPILTSFNGGEISPRMSGRVDTAIYQVALEACENFVPTVEGPIAKRGGFELIQSAAATASWVTAFRFNLTQDYDRMERGQTSVLHQRRADRDQPRCRL
jgi:hypothetical protein